MFLPPGVFLTLVSSGSQQNKFQIGYVAIFLYMETRYLTIASSQHVFPGGGKIHAIWIVFRAILGVVFFTWLQVEPSRSISRTPPRSLRRSVTPMHLSNLTDASCDSRFSKWVSGCVQHRPAKNALIEWSPENLDCNMLIIGNSATQSRMFQR